MIVRSQQFLVVHEFCFLVKLSSIFRSYESFSVSGICGSVICSCSGLVGYGLIDNQFEIPIVDIDAELVSFVCERLRFVHPIGSLIDKHGSVGRDVDPVQVEIWMCNFALLDCVAENTLTFWSKVEDYGIPVGDGLEDEADVTQFYSTRSNLVADRAELCQAENSTSQHAD